MNINQKRNKQTKTTQISWSSVTTIKSKLWKEKDNKGNLKITYIFEKWSVKQILHDMNGLFYYNDQTCPTFCNPLSHRLFCPWNFPGKNTGVGCRSAFQGTFPTQGLTHTFCVSCTGRLIPYHWCWNRKPGSVRGAEEWTPQTSKHSHRQSLF